LSASGALPYLVADVRRLIARYEAGGPPAVDAFHELVTVLLSNTVLSPSAYINRSRGPRPRTIYLGGLRHVTDPLPLRDGRFLRFSMTLYVDDATQRLKVEASSIQYQMTIDNGTWIFRYDYDRSPNDPEPAAHLQVRGSLAEACLPLGRDLQDIQFPTNRVGVEAVIRLLVESYDVPCADWVSVWRGVLAETEQAFLRIAHRPPSGPSVPPPESA
jgi:hypothetical protein